MNSRYIFFAATSVICLWPHSSQSQTDSGRYSTPAYNGSSGANASSNFAQNYSTAAGTNLGANYGTVIGQQSTVLGQPGAGLAITPGGSGIALSPGAATGITISGRTNN